VNAWIAPALVAACALAAVHIVTPSLRFLGGTPRSIWLSIAGGVSVAYVFVHLLPELAASQEDISRAARNAGIFFAERHVYLIALAGLAVFYGLDKLAKHSRARGLSPTAPDSASADHNAEADPEAVTSTGVFWIHIGSFGIYNMLIGYLLLHREVPGLSSLIFFAIAMALHFFVTDFSLNEDHKHRYRRTGRWMLVAALFAGLGVGAAMEIPKAALGTLVGFLAGGVILNVLKEEVPGERRSRFWAFALGMSAYAILLLTV
jgi:hypothetical protein